MMPHEKCAALHADYVGPLNFSAGKRRYVAKQIKPDVPGRAIYDRAQQRFLSNREVDKLTLDELRGEHG